MATKVETEHANTKPVGTRVGKTEATETEEKVEATETEEKVEATETEEKVEATETEAMEVPKRMPVDEKTVAVVMVHAYDSLYHPYQRRWVPTADMCPEGVEMPIDSWLQSQIEAGLVKAV